MRKASADLLSTAHRTAPHGSDTGRIGRRYPGVIVGARVQSLLLILTIPLAAIGGYLLGTEGDDDGNAIPRIAGAEQAAEFAASEARYNYAPGTPGFSRAAALSTMNLVETNVSAPRWGELLKQGIAPTGPTEVWAAQAALCQGSSDAYQAVMTELGIRTRRLEIYWVAPDGQENSHATVETWWAGGWHWLDPTYGVVYTSPGDAADILSFEQVRSGRPKRLRLNETDEWWMQGLAERAPNPIGFVGWPDHKVVWMPVREALSSIPTQVRELEPLTERESYAPPPELTP